MINDWMDKIITTKKLKKSFKKVLKKAKKTKKKP